MAVLVVLLLLSLTLGLCYAATRSQYTTSTIQRNADRQAAARQAAVTGTTMALKKMQLSDWSGVGGSLSGSLDAYTTFVTTYTAGDSRLSAADADQPYRVTLLTTGYAVDWEHPQSIATYQVKAVVRLIPRALAAEPSDFAAIKGYTVFQTKQQDVQIDVPCRITGPTRLQKKLQVAAHYPNDDDSRTLYLSGLNKMRVNGLADDRPLNGPVYLPLSVQDPKFYTWLTSSLYGLGVTAIDTAAQELTTDWSQPSTSPGSYRIYPGGPTYAFQALPTTLQSITLQPDPTTNPLGLFSCDSTLTINSDVTVQGSIFCGGDLRFAGANISVQPVALPPLQGTSKPIRLPATSSQNATVKAGGSGQVTGLMAVFGNFLVEQGSESMAFSLAGQLATAGLSVQQRTEWNLDWSSYRNLYNTQLLLFPLSTSKYFPVWMANRGRDPTPKLLFAPESQAVTYHWANAYDPIFVAAPSDGGLRWDLLAWIENP